MDHNLKIVSLVIIVFGDFFFLNVLLCDYKPNDELKVRIKMREPAGSDDSDD